MELYFCWFCYYLTSNIERRWHEILCATFALCSWSQIFTLQLVTCNFLDVTFNFMDKHFLLLGVARYVLFCCNFLSSRFLFFRTKVAYMKIWLYDAQLHTTFYANWLINKNKRTLKIILNSQICGYKMIIKVKWIFAIFVIIFLF